MKATLRILMLWATCSVSASAFSQELATGPISADNAIVKAYLARWSDTIQKAQRLSATFRIQYYNRTFRDVQVGQGVIYRDADQWSMKIVPFDSEQLAAFRVEKNRGLDVANWNVKPHSTWSVIDGPTEMYVCNNDRNIYEMVNWSPVSSTSPDNPKPFWNIKYFLEACTPEHCFPLFVRLGELNSEYQPRPSRQHADFFIIDFLPLSSSTSEFPRLARVAFRPGESLPFSFLVSDPQGHHKVITIKDLKLNRHAEIPPGTFDRPTNVYDPKEHLRALQTK